MKKLLFLIMALVLVLGLVVPAALASEPGFKTIPVKQSTLEEHQGECEHITLWHFVINQIASEAQVPGNITVQWDCDDDGIYDYEADVLLEKYTGKTAHYTTTDNAGCVVTDATAEIYSAWSGQFNLSHIECSGDGGGTTGRVCVDKFYDADADGIWGDFEDAIPDWEIEVYDDAGVLVGTLDTPDCIELEPGNYTFSEVIPDGWGNTTQASVSIEVFALSVDFIDFGNIQLGKICVDKFYDVNQDGQKGQDENWLDDWEVKIYDEAGALVDTLSTPDCSIWLYPGNYTVTETIPEGWGNTTPASVPVEVIAGMVQGDKEYDVEFGNIQLGKICVEKFYDANTNGDDDEGVYLCGWEVKIYDEAGALVDTLSTPDCSIWLYPGNYTVTETIPAGWVNTTPKSVPVEVIAGMVQGDKEYDVEFGNVCLGAGGGKTLGFWSNKNGQATMNDGGTLAPELVLLSSLNLRNAAGVDFNTTSYPVFRTWLLGANASNMAYMLSAQLAAMELNVEAGLVNSGALVYLPCTGFISVSDLMAAANTELGLHGVTTAGSPDRAYQECLKNALDKANNNMNFVQRTPCGYICPTPAP